MAENMTRRLFSFDYYPPPYHSNLAPSWQPASGRAHMLSSDWLTLLLDKLTLPDEYAFYLNWLAGLPQAKVANEATLATRIARCARLAGHHQISVKYIQLLGNPNPTWNTIDLVRFYTERAFIAMKENKYGMADDDVRSALRYAADLERQTGYYEHADALVARSLVCLGLKQSDQAQQSYSQACLFLDRLENSSSVAQMYSALGQIAFALEQPTESIDHFEQAMSSVRPNGLTTLLCHGNLAINFAVTGSYVEARHHGAEAVRLSRQLKNELSLADSLDCLAFSELLAGEGRAAQAAAASAWSTAAYLSESFIHTQIARHRAWSHALLAQVDEAYLWLTRSDKLTPEAELNLKDQGERIYILARILDAKNDPKETLAFAEPALLETKESFWRGSLAALCGRLHLKLGSTDKALSFLEQAALLGDHSSWIYPLHPSGGAFYALGLGSGDSRVVRFCEKMKVYDEHGSQASRVKTSSFLSELDHGVSLQGEGARPMEPTRSSVDTMLLAAHQDPETTPANGRPMVYITTNEGVVRCTIDQIDDLVQNADVVVDTVTHSLRVRGKEFSLERRRALEPLVVQLLRRSKQGLNSTQILKASGSPGAETLEAEHRVRVLIFRIRDLLGDPLSIERIRDPGEHGRTRYRIGKTLRFALIEPASIR